MKRFNIKTIISFTIFVGVAGFLYFSIYKPLLSFNPAIPKIINTIDTIYFDVNSTTPQFDSYLIIEKVAKNKINKPIRIIGGADTTGNFLLNWKLSWNRARTVREMLISLKVDSNLITAVGFGDMQPLVPNTNLQNKQINRYTIIKWSYYEKNDSL